MFKKIKEEFNLTDYKNLLSNFAFLSLLQVVGFVLPLIIIPHLVKVLGMEKVGLVFFAQAFLSYFSVFTDYGFNLSAPRDISVNRDDIKRVSEIFNSVLATKIILGVVSLVVLALLITIIPKLRGEYSLFYLSFSLVLGQILFPSWFFQGVEQMRFITYLNITSKLLFTGLIFVFVKSPNQYIYVNFFQGAATILSAVLSIWVVREKFKIKLKFPGIATIKEELKNGWHILVSSFSVNVYLNSNIIILGCFANAVTLGYYSIAEKIMLAVRQLLVVFSLVTYPHVCKLGSRGHQQLIKFYKTIFTPFFIFILMSCVALYIFSGDLVRFLTHNTVEYISNLVKLLSVVPIIVCLNIPAYQTLLAYNLKRSYSVVLTVGALFSLLLNAILSYYYSAVGTCISIIVTETLILIGLYLVLELKNKSFSLLQKYI